MKRLIFVLLLFLPLLILATIDVEKVDTISIDKETDLKAIATELRIPVKKLIECLELPLSTNSHTKLTTLSIQKPDIREAVKKYNEIRYHFYWSIVLLGMIIVFASLVVTGFIINLLQHTDRPPKKQKTKKIVYSPFGKISSSTQLSNNEIVAAITTIFLHEMEVEEQNKMILTWKRAPLSLWKVSRILPNQEFYKSKR